MPSVARKLTLGSAGALPGVIFFFYGLKDDAQNNVEEVQRICKALNHNTQQK